MGLVGVTPILKTMYHMNVEGPRMEIYGVFSGVWTRRGKWRSHFTHNDSPILFCAKEQEHSTTISAAMLLSAIKGMEEIWRRKLMCLLHRFLRWKVQMNFWKTT